MYDEKYIKIKQARLDRSRLLAVCQHIDRSACFAYYGSKGILPVQTLSLGEV